MRYFIIILGLSLLLESCLVSRTISPKLTGYVFDANSKKPIDSCKVNGIYTNSRGNYKMKRTSYREFTFIGMEGPNGPGQSREHLRSRNDLILSKDGFYNDTIKIQEPYGRNMRKGAHWKMDTIFLKAIN